VGDPELATGPGGVGALLRAALALYLARARLYIALTAFAVVPVAIALFALALAAPDPHAAQTPITRLDAAANALLVLPLTVGATAWAVAEQLAGGRPQLRPVLLRTLARASLLVGTTVLAAVLTFAGLVAFVVPGLMLLVWFQLACQVVVLEERSFVPALARSRALVRGRFWKVVLVDLAILAAALVATVVVAIPTLLLLLPFDGSDRSRLAATALGAIPADVLVLPWCSIALTLLYVRLRGTTPA
jgi:hypothetical protein